MENELLENIIGVCSVLSKYGVEYLIVGGTAVALHGYFRITTDMAGKPNEKHDLDFWYNPTYGNYFNLLKALDELGLDITEYKNESVPNPKKSFFKFETSKFTLDFLPELKSLKKFIAAFNSKEIVPISGTEIWFISYEDLITEKLESGRPKDIADIDQLNLIRDEESEEDTSLKDSE